MAEQTKKKKSAATNKKTGGRKTAAQKKKEEEARSRRQFWAVIVFAVGIFFLAVTLISGQGLWNGLHNICFGLFGWCAYLLAPAMLYIAVMAAMEKQSGALKHKVWQTFVLVALVCGAAQIFAKTPIEGEGFVESAKLLYENGVQRKGGGLVSAIFAVPLMSFGKTPAAVTILILIFTFVMLITGSTLLDLIRSAYKPVKKISDRYVERVEERRRTSFDIDVPLDDVKAAAPSQTENSSQEMPAQESGEPVKKAREKLLRVLGGSQSQKEEPSVQESAPQNAQDPAGEAPQEVSVEYVSADKLVATGELVAADRLSDGSDEMQDVNPLPLRKNDLSAENDEIKPLLDPVENCVKSVAGGDEEPDRTQPVPPALDEPVLGGAEGATAMESYNFPPVSLLSEGEKTDDQDLSELRATGQLLVDTLSSFGVQTKIVDISRGPSVTRYELQPSAGVKISRITNLADDIALNLATSGVRIEAPIPNKAAVGIEVPNRHTSIVPIREIIDSQEFRQAKSKVTVCLGKDIGGSVCVADIAKMPHILIAGATGSGKSVCINSIIMSILYKADPDDVRLLMVDPKVVELGVYNGIPHLLVPVVTDPHKAAGALSWAVSEMMGRYKLFADNSVRDIVGFNRLAQEHPERNLSKMPQIVIIIDELADLMIAAQNDVEDAICRLAQMARAAGMHLVIATQRPSVDVITGLIKANIPSRIAFAVSSQVDSRTILDAGGAEKLLGKGDMLFFPVGAAKPVRIQGCFVSDKEVEKVVSFIKGSQTAEYDDQIIEEIERQAENTGNKQNSGNSGGGLDADDEILPAAIECVVESGQASTSLLQRKLKLGYARAARIVDELEERGIVGPFEGSKPRQVLITRQQWIEMKMRSDQNGGETDETGE